MRREAFNCLSDLICWTLAHVDFVSDYTMFYNKIICFFYFVFAVLFLSFVHQQLLGQIAWADRHDVSCLKLVISLACLSCCWMVACWLLHSERLGWLFFFFLVPYFWPCAFFIFFLSCPPTSPHNSLLTPPPKITGRLMNYVNILTCPSVAPLWQCLFKCVCVVCAIFFYIV